MTKLFEGARREKKYVAKSIAFALVFFLLQFVYQFYGPSAGVFEQSLIRSTAFSAATLIGISLLIGPFSRLFPKKNYIIHRRTIGVLGFTFAIAHALAVIIYVFNSNVFGVLYNLNPYTSPIVFGVITFLIFIPVYLTSTDWAIQKMGARRWRTVQRLVYITFILLVLHFILINPGAMMTPPGYLLLAVTSLVFMTQLAAFINHTRRNKGKGRYVALLIIIIGIVLFYLAYSIDRNSLALYLIPVSLLGAFLLVLITGKKTQQTQQMPTV